MNRFLLKGWASVCALAVMFGTVSCSEDDKPVGTIAVSAGVWSNCQGGRVGDIVRHDYSGRCNGQNDNMEFL